MKLGVHIRVLTYCPIILCLAVLIAISAICAGIALGVIKEDIGSRLIHKLAICLCTLVPFLAVIYAGATISMTRET